MPGEGSLTATVIRWSECSSGTPVLDRCPGPHRPTRRADRAWGEAEPHLRRPRLTGTTEPGPGCAKHPQPGAPATPWWSPSWTGGTVADNACNIIEELTEAGVKLTIGGPLHDPNDPVGRLLFNVLGMIAEFESDLIGMPRRGA